MPTPPTRQIRSHYSYQWIGPRIRQRSPPSPHLQSPLCLPRPRSHPRPPRSPRPHPGRKLRPLPFDFPLHRYRPRFDLRFRNPRRRRPPHSSGNPLLPKTNLLRPYRGRIHAHHELRDPSLAPRSDGTEPQPTLLLPCPATSHPRKNYRRRIPRTISPHPLCRPETILSRRGRNPHRCSRHPDRSLSLIRC